MADHSSITQILSEKDSDALEYFLKKYVRI